MNKQNPVGKTKSQGWEIGVSRTLPVSPVKAWDMMMAALGIAWEDTAYEKGTPIETDDKTRVEIRSYERGSLIRMKWQPEGWDFRSTLQIRVKPAKTGATISVHHEWLENAEQREAMRQHWTAILEELKASVESH